MALRWPEPPLITRIEMVRTIARPADIAHPPSLWQTLGAAVGVLGGDVVRPLAQPADVAVTPDGGTVYVTDFAQGLVHVFDLATGQTRYLGVDEPLARPFGITLDRSGNLWIVEQAASQVRVLDPAGETLQIVRSERFVRPVDVALDEARGKVYVVDGSRQFSHDHYVHVFDLAGRPLGTVGAGRGSGDGMLLFPTYAAVDDSGNLLVSDTMNSRVAIFDPDGRFVRSIGGRGDGVGDFDKPKGVALDSFGNVFVVDSSWSNVQIFGPDGDVLLFFGGRGGYPGLLRNPTGIAIARATNTIFVADYLNRRLCVYQLVNTGPEDGKAQPVEGARFDP